MGLIYRVLLVFTFLGAVFFSNNVFATHVGGADITYQNIGQDSFLITLNVYRDCGGVQLNTGNVDVEFVSDCGQSFTLGMNLVNGPNGDEVSQLCPDSLTSSTCNGGTWPGVQHYIFQEIAVLPNDCDAWHMSWTFSARNLSANLTDPGGASGYDLHVSSSINSATDPSNSSPTFNNNTIPFVCLNQVVNYNFGVQEPDGDSLVYSLVDPLQAANTPVAFLPGFSTQAPIPGITLHSGTGQLTFTPTSPGTYVIVVDVCEYDRVTGALVGCVTRDIQVIVQNCFNAPPTNIGGGLTNASLTAVNIGNDSIGVCAGELLTFDIVYLDNDSVIVVSLVSDITDVLDGATTSFSSTATTGTLSVNWPVPNDADGAFTFAVEAFDNVCPIPGVTSNSYTVIVNPTTFASNDTTICFGDTANVSVQGGNNFTWSVVSGDPIDTVTSSPTYNASCSDCANPQFSPSVTTTYRVVSDITGFCSNVDTVIVTVSNINLTVPDSAEFCMGDSVQVTATGAATSFAWSSGDAIVNPFFFGGNTYYVTATDAVGCIQTDSVFVTEQPNPNFTLGGDTLVCQGSTFNRTVTPSNAYVSYLWSDGSVGSTLAIDESTVSVWVEVEDSNSCKSADTLQVIPVANPTVNLDGDTTICTYDSIALTALYNIDYSYAWSAPAADTNVIWVEDPGVYTVTVVDTLLCQTIDTIEVFEFQDAPVTLGGDSGYCSGDTATIYAQSQFVTYTWSNGTVGQDSILVNAAGQYSVTVTDTNSCQSSDTATFIQYASPVVDLGSDVIHCIGTSISVLKDLGPNWVSHLWHDGSTAQTYTVTELDDTVWVEVQDTNGCFASDTIVVIHTAPPVIDLGADTSYCADQQYTLRATPNMQSYSWSHPNGGADTLLVTAADTYSVTITDTTGCTSNDSIIIQFDTLPQPTLGADFNKCVEDTSLLDGGSGYLLYAWSTGETTQTILASAEGTYQITVTDSNTCVGSTGIVITNDTVPVVNIGPDDFVCDGDSLMLDAGSGWSSYNWSNGAISQTTYFSVAGNHSVTITDGNTCEGSDTMLLSIWNLPSVDLGPDQQVCDGDSTTFDAGPNMFGYAWNTGDTTQTINVNVAGNYEVTVTDSNLCQNSDTAGLIVNANPQPQLPADIENCTGSSFSQLVDAGAGYALYNWMDGTFTQIRNATQNDTVIWVEVTDTNTCVGSDTMYVIHLPLPTVNIGPDDSICASQGYTLNAGNGNGAIVSYLWTNGATTQSIAIPANPGLIADVNTVYAVTVTDTNSCSNSDNMNLLTYALPTPVLPADTNYCQGDPFAMTLDPGTFVTYLWSTGAVTPTINIGAVPNTYGVTVTDANGCANDTNMTVTEFAIPQPNLGPDEAYCEGTNYSKVLNPGNYQSYLWQDGSTGKVYGITSAGLYAVTVTNTFGCVNDDDILITENPAPPVDLGSNQFFCEDAQVSTVLDASTQLPGGGFSFVWSTGATSATILVTNFGNYSVTVADQATGCTSDSEVEIIPFPKAEPDLGEDGRICEGQIITLSPNVSIPGYNYLWSTGATTPTITVFETGTYWVEMNADNGSCLGITDTISFTIGQLPVVELGEDQYVCEGQTVKLLNESTAYPGATYVWEDGSVQSERFITETGNYEIAVTNECGTVYDQVYLEFQDCFGFFVPNSFTPNGDGVNDTFYPKSDQEFREYGFWVYDRWGKLVFKTNQPGHGWDGTINGEPALVGKYTWRVSYVSAFQVYGTRIEKVGEVNLLK